MRFPIVIHQENDSAFGVIVPDMPGCFSAGDTLDEALENVHEAIDMYMEEVVNGHEAVPVPSALDTVVSNPDHEGGTFFLVEVDLPKYLGKADKINVTLPRYLIDRIDHAVNEGRYKSRSGMLAESAMSALAQLK